jgi:hypothetical protein
VDWRAWHQDYEDSGSALARRLLSVQEQVRAALDRAAPGPLRTISICAGQGHDLIGVLAEHPRRPDVTARLVELDEDNALRARRAIDAARLDGVEVVIADASITDSYAGFTPANLILLCGVFGNIASADIAKTVGHLPRLCDAEATVIWTRHRHPPDLTPFIRETFKRAGFDELAFEGSPQFGIGAHRLLAPPQPFKSNIRLFEFVGYDILQPDFQASQQLVASDSSLLDLIEAVRALPYGRPSDRSVEGMLRERRGTCSTKHLFLARTLAERFPETEPLIVHRVYRLDRTRARELFDTRVANVVPEDGLVDVHRYLTIVVDSRRITVDATFPGSPWDGRSSLPLACGPGRDYPAGEDPDAEKHALEAKHCDPRVREPFIAVLASVERPQR